MYAPPSASALASTSAFISARAVSSAASPARKPRAKALSAGIYSEQISLRHRLGCGSESRKIAGNLLRGFPRLLDVAMLRQQVRKLSWKHSLQYSLIHMAYLSSEGDKPAEHVIYPAARYVASSP